MILADLSVRRPVAMGCLLIGLTLLGLLAWRRLDLELMPQVDLPFITVVTVFPGAGPREVETDIAQRIEDAIAGIDGLRHITSICSENVCQTLLEFELEVDVDITSTEVRERIDLIRGDLPAGTEDPQILKFDIGAAPIITLALTGDAPLDALYDYAANDLKDRLGVLPGVAELQLIGGAPREVQVRLDRARLAARGLTTGAIAQVLAANLGTVPVGRIRDTGEEIGVTFDAGCADLDALADLEVAGAAGARCRIRDLGEVVLTTSELRRTATVDGRSAVAIRVVKKADANAVAVSATVRAELTRLASLLPGGMELVWVTGDGRFIEATNASAWSDVAQGILLTAAILLLFLHHLRSLLVVSVTMPLTIIIGLFGMRWFGYSLNTSTLIAIGLSVGVLVTNSIVVIEATIARLAAGDPPPTAARIGAHGTWIPVLASAGTNAVVLFPLAVMGSLIGRWIQPLAITMLIMTVVSLFISFTLTPMLCALLLSPMRAAATATRRGLFAWFSAIWDAGQTRFITAYQGILRVCDRHRVLAVLVLLAVLGVFVHSLSWARRLGSSFATEPDKGEILVKLEYPVSFPLARTRAEVVRVETRLRGLPELRCMLSMVGKVDAILGQVAEGPHLAQILLRFSERDERMLTIDDLIAAVRGRLVDLPGVTITVNQSMMVGGQGAELELEIAGTELDQLKTVALAVRDLADAIPGIEDADTTVRMGKREVRIRPRRDVLADLGLPASLLGGNLRGNLEGLPAGTFERGDRTYDVVVRFQEEEGRGQLAGFPLPTGTGGSVALTAASTLTERPAPVQITRVDRRRIAKVTANLAPDLPLGTAAAAIEAAMARTGVIPPGCDYRFAGMFTYMSEAQAALGEAGVIALLLLVLSLAAILESFRQMLLLLVTLPLALVGVIDALVLTGGSLGIFEIMSMVMLIGIVVNNAILIIDRFNVLVAAGRPRHQAMITAAGERFRAVTMITIAAVLGMLPLALGSGIGAEIRTGVGIASTGGILMSGILTMIVVPVLYNLLTRRDRPPAGV